MRILLWHVHGSYTTSLVHGPHEYLIPTTPDRGPDGRGRAATWDWPVTPKELNMEEARNTDVDVVILQRPKELASLARLWLGGREPGRDIPAVYLEHNTPPTATGDCAHPVANRADIPVVHVTYSNALFW